MYRFILPLLVRVIPNKICLTEGLSGLHGNVLGPFLGDWALVTAPGYPTIGRLKTFLDGVPIWVPHKSQSLIGRLKTKLGNQ